MVISKAGGVGMLVREGLVDNYAHATRIGVLDALTVADLKGNMSTTDQLARVRVRLLGERPIWPN